MRYAGIFFFFGSVVFDKSTHSYYMNHIYIYTKRRHMSNARLLFNKQRLLNHINQKFDVIFCKNINVTHIRHTHAPIGSCVPNAIWNEMKLDGCEIMRFAIFAIFAILLLLFLVGLLVWLSIYIFSGGSMFGVFFIQNAKFWKHKKQLINNQKNSYQNVASIQSIVEQWTSSFIVIFWN